MACTRAAARIVAQSDWSHASKSSSLVCVCVAVSAAASASADADRGRCPSQAEQPAKRVIARLQRDSCTYTGTHGLRTIRSVVRACLRPPVGSLSVVDTAAAGYAGGEREAERGCGFLFKISGQHERDHHFLPHHVPLLSCLDSCCSCSPACATGSLPVSPSPPCFPCRRRRRRRRRRSLELRVSNVRVGM